MSEFSESQLAEMAGALADAARVAAILELIDPASRLGFTPWGNVRAFTEGQIRRALATGEMSTPRRAPAATQGDETPPAGLPVPGEAPQADTGPRATASRITPTAGNASYVPRPNGPFRVSLRARQEANLGAFGVDIGYDGLEHP